MIGASGRPVLHAASFPVEANDTDEGQIAQEAMGVNGMYLNVRDLGTGDAGASLPLRLAPAVRACSFEGGRGGEAAVDVAAASERFRVTAVSGGNDSPAQRYLDQLNETARVAPADRVHTRADRGREWRSDQRLRPACDRAERLARRHRSGAIHAGDQSIDLTITEFSSSDAASFVTGRMPLTIGPAEFVHPQDGTGYETGRSFLAAGHAFQLWVRSPDQSPAAPELERVNAFLASFHADPGDFYPGTVDPAAFAPADGWDTGSTGPAEIQPDGQQTMSWASTVPYRDSGLQFPPSATLGALPPTGSC